VTAASGTRADQGSSTSGAGTAREWEGEEGERGVTEPSEKSRIGLTGLAVMGANLARNIARRGTPTVWVPENAVMSCDQQVLVYETAEAIPS
jgi:hypothetical protein